VKIPDILIASSMSPRRHVSQFPTPAQRYIERLLAKNETAHPVAIVRPWALGDTNGVGVRIEMALEVERGVRR
jgi:hypothetical protein